MNFSHILRSTWLKGHSVLFGSALVALLLVEGFIPANAQRSLRAGDDAKEAYATATIVGTRPLGRITEAPEAVDPTSVYSNVTTFTGTVLFAGGAAADPTTAGNTITRIIADDIVGINTAGSGPPYTITGVKLAVGNLNTTAQSVRVRMRFWQADGANGGPGTFITGLTFNPISFTGNQVTILNGGITAPGITLPKTFWAGVQFDNNVGATGAGATELNNFGVGVFNPVDRGSSQDRHFLTSTATNFNLVNNPPGTINNDASVVDNFGWEFTTAATVTAGGVELKGRVLSPDGRGIRGTTMTLTAPDGTSQSVLTNRLGAFRFEDVQSGRSYILNASNRRYTFDAQVIPVTDNISDITFSGTPRGDR